MLALSLNVQGDRGRTARDDAWMPRTRLPPESQEPIGSLQSELCHHKSMLNDWYIIIFPPLIPERQQVSCSLIECCNCIDIEGSLHPFGSSRCFDGLFSVRRLELRTTSQSPQRDNRSGSAWCMQRVVA